MLNWKDFPIARLSSIFVVESHQVQWTDWLKERVRVTDAGHVTQDQANKLWFGRSALYKPSLPQKKSVTLKK